MAQVACLETISNDAAHHRQREARVRSHPPNPDVLPYVYKFMSRFGEASMMKKSESFVAAFGSVKNQLGASVWDALSLDTRHKNEDLVLWRQALLKTMMTCNDRVVSVGDIKRSLSNAQMLTKIIVFEKNLLTLKLSLIHI